MKIVIDTNIIISAIFFGGVPLECMNLLLNGVFRACVSDEILDEYLEIYQRFLLKYPNKTLKMQINKIIEHMEIITPTSKINVCCDPDDNKFIECAVDGHCIYIVSGDKDLLAVKNFDDIEILTLHEFFEKYPF
ncbi:MAG: putative toxin-antitoxin system toxin component, PIN family [Synergistaceae bacterium]|nr:putative toxin-antitoxin system toxin component, PIN family [Synergistaceae bacterium]